MQDEQPASPPDEALAADWLKRIEAALARPQIKSALATFETNRKLLRGIDPRNGERVRTNLHFANLAAMRPQVYAKDPEYAVTPTAGVPPAALEATRKFGQAAEAVLTQTFVKDAKLKKRMKRTLTSAYATSVGWLKLCWQEDKQTDPLIAAQIKDTQDNLAQLQDQRQQLDDPAAGASHDLQIAKLQQTLAGLQSQSEVTVARGLTLDFLLSEDVIVVDPGVRELGDYERAGGIAHRVWMTRDKYRQTFKKDCVGGTGYAEQAGSQMAANLQSGGDPNAELLCVWEIWDQSSNRVLHVCTGAKGFCRDPFSPDWTGKRWYPFFCVMFNEIDGTFYPLSDIEMTELLVREYNETRGDWVRDRRRALPITLVRKGGSLTPSDVEKMNRANGGDIIAVEGVGGQPIGNDVWSGSLAALRAENYDTAPARADIEMTVGGGDATRGAVLKAKTATEAEILAQGLRGRSEERQDCLEDMLTDMGTYALQVCLRKMTPQEVARIAGPDAEAVWPVLSADQVFDTVSVSVRGGSTGKPNQAQEQERWTKLLPVIEKTVQQVSELRAAGQAQLAQALIELTRETLRRFDERLDIDQFMPPAPQDGQPDPMAAMQEAQQLKAKLQEVAAEMQQLRDKTEKGYISAAASIATAQDPTAAANAFQSAINVLEGQPPMPMPGAPPPDPAVAEMSQHVAELQAKLAEATANRDAEIRKAELNAVSSVEVGKHKAEVDAQANVAIAKHRAEVEALSNAVIAKAQGDKEAQAAGKKAEQAKSMRVQHIRDANGRLVESRLVSDQQPAASPK